MNPASIRRLAADQASLRQSLPPNYLFPDVDDNAGCSDDLTQLAVLLTGANGTPYSQGLWRLQLKMPEDYPKNPPKATFKTRIYHPNVDESTGAVCLDTLKRDWESKLTLRDILITISCLLIHPNPDSALNSTAGSLLQEDYEAFARQARLMTSIHAPIPPRLKAAVLEAKSRGEEGGVILEDAAVSRPTTSRASSNSSSVMMKKKSKASTRPQPISVQGVQSKDQESESGEKHDEAKENDPSQSLSPVSPPLLGTRKNVLGKRPLSELPTPTDPDTEDPLAGEESGNMTESEKNILAGQILNSFEENSQPLRKSPKLERSAQDSSDKTQDLLIYEDCPRTSSMSQSTEEEKENVTGLAMIKKIKVTKQAPTEARPTLRKVSNIGSSRGKGAARTGIRRL